MYKVLARKAEVVDNQDDTSNPAKHDWLYWEKKKEWDKQEKESERPGVDRSTTHSEYVRLRQQRDDAFRGNKWSKYRYRKSITIKVPPLPLSKIAAHKVEVALSKKSASAYSQDIQLSTLPEETQQDIKRFCENANGSSKVPQYGMVVLELIPKADPHNLEVAEEHCADMDPEKAREEVASRQDDKYILLCNDRIVDGHHYLAKAKRGDYTASIKCLDLTPLRFQQPKVAQRARGERLETMEYTFNDDAGEEVELTLEIERYRGGGSPDDPSEFEIVSAHDALGNDFPIEKINMNDVDAKLSALDAGERENEMYDRYT